VLFGLLSCSLQGDECKSRKNINKNAKFETVTDFWVFEKKEIFRKSNFYPEKLAKFDLNDGFCLPRGLFSPSTSSYGSKGHPLCMIIASKPSDYKDSHPSIVSVGRALGALYQ
jgi:hypothetical protein